MYNVKNVVWIICVSIICEVKFSSFITQNVIKRIDLKFLSADLIQKFLTSNISFLLYDGTTLLTYFKIDSFL